MWKAVKQYGGAIFIITVFAAFILSTAKKRKFDSSLGVHVTDSSVRADILSTFDIEVKEIHGIQVTDHDADTVSFYFEYEADYREVLNTISALPIQIDDNISAMRCGLLNSPTNPLDNSKKIAREEVDASEFFWDAKPEEYIFYECLKGSLKHLLLVSKTSSRILHKVEVS
jgi:hypothetical protein